MFPVSARAQAGLTLVETMVTIVVLGILLAVGIPSMREWLGATNAAGAAQFYAEGFQMGRTQALANNSRSRVVFATNAKSGQLNWQVDVCFPTGLDACDADSNRWSGVDDAAATPALGAVATKSVFRSAAGLPPTTALTVTPESDDRSVYFTELGWVDGARPMLTRFDFTPASGTDEVFDSSAVVLTLAGAVTTCKPAAAAGDSRRCP